MPVSVYMRLVDGVNRHLPTFHRYPALRKKMMGITDDLHTTICMRRSSPVNLRYTPEERRSTSSARWRRSGPTTPAFCSRRSRSGGWIGLRPKARCRARCSNGGAYDVHPFMR